MKPLTLIVDDESDQLETLRALLEGEGYRVESCASKIEALALMKKYPADVILADHKMIGEGGIKLRAATPRGAVPSPVIIVTAHAPIESAVDFIKKGAFDYLVKPLNKTRTLLAVRKASERVSILKENARLNNELYGRFCLDGIVAQSPAMLQVIKLLQKVVDSSSTVMTLGESGSGKELVARAIHYNSSRRNHPFTAVNCAAIPEALFENELFGHESGSFTGALRRHQGFIEASNGGTLFLDEIADLPMAMQPKLLRVLQDHQVRRIGGMESIHVDVRFITATNKDLVHEVEKGTFREDLFYRLNVVTIELPPLRERREDIVPLVEHYLEKFSTEFGRSHCEVAPDAMQLLLDYRWPGNVRQLAAVIERAVLLSDSHVLTREDVASRLLARKAVDLSQFELPENGLDLEAFEKEMIRKAMQRTGGRATHAAQLLHMSYKTFLYRMEKYGINTKL